MRTELIIRFEYGIVVPWVTRQEDGALRAVAGPDMLTLRTPVSLHGENHKTVGEFTVSAGRRCLSCSPTRHLTFLNQIRSTR